MVLFKAYFKVMRHASSKNEKDIYYNKKTGRSFIGKEDKTIACQNWILNQLQIERIRQRIDEPITCDLNAKFTFYFPYSVYFTKKGQRSLTLPDLSNLYELPQDCLQYDFSPFKKNHPRYKEMRIIHNDGQIVSHDGSRRLPIEDKDYYLEIELTKYEGNI